MVCSSHFIYQVVFNGNYGQWPLWRFSSSFPYCFSVLLKLSINQKWIGGNYFSATIKNVYSKSARASWKNCNQSNPNCKPLWRTIKDFNLTFLPWPHLFSYLWRRKWIIYTIKQKRNTFNAFITAKWKTFNNQREKKEETERKLNHLRPYVGLVYRQQSQSVCVGWLTDY